MAENALLSQKISFPGSTGETLAARLDRPKGPVRAYALFAHCFTCSKDVFAAARLASALVERGYGVFRFDFTGLGMSGGDFANTNFSSNVADLVAAAGFMRETYEAPSILIGHSLGGAAVLAAASSVPEAVAVATIGAPADAAHVREQFKASLDEIETKGVAQVVLAGRTFTIRKQFLDDIAASVIEDKIAHLRKALLIFHAPLDQTVGIDNASRIFLAAKHPKSFVSLDGADHLLTRREDAIYVAEVLSAWASRYLPEQASADAPAALPEGLVRVAETREGPLQARVEVGRHAFLADEPVALGGEDTGPTPHELLLGALGACTCLTLRLYAGRKGYDVSRISAELRRGSEKVSVDGVEKEVEVISREIHIDGGLSDDDREKMLAIANRCPVHRTLMNPDKRIDTKLV
ncbi:MAG: alpha/beta fold hydrolase [Parvibaculaceae bacterium]|nr:alpha/beta fold hydrolase [Parvibaculaceae bacterium]